MVTASISKCDVPLPVKKKKPKQTQPQQWKEVFSLHNTRIMFSQSLVLSDVNWKKAIWKKYHFACSFRISFFTKKISILCLLLSNYFWFRYSVFSLCLKFWMEFHMRFLSIGRNKQFICEENGIVQLSSVIATEKILPLWHSQICKALSQNTQYTEV